MKSFRVCHGTLFLSPSRSVGIPFPTDGIVNCIPKYSKKLQLIQNDNFEKEKKKEISWFNHYRFKVYPCITLNSHEQFWVSLIFLSLKKIRDFNWFLDIVFDNCHIY